VYDPAKPAGISRIKPLSATASNVYVPFADEAANVASVVELTSDVELAFLTTNVAFVVLEIVTEPNTADEFDTNVLLFTDAPVGTVDVARYSFERFTLPNLLTEPLESKYPTIKTNTPTATIKNFLLFICFLN